MIAVALSLVGLILMAVARLVALLPSPPSRPAWSWIFAPGLLLAIGAHGLPGGLR